MTSDIPGGDRSSSGSQTQGRLDPSLDPRFAIGTQFGRYQEVQFLGAGGMGVVFKGFDPTLGRRVALKLIHNTGATEASHLLLEAKAQARIEHENVCRVYDAGVEGGRPYIAMQYIEGRTLGEVVAELSLEELLRLARDVAFGVHAAHRAGLVHRDLKPANVMVERLEDGRWHPYVMDFGLAREVGVPGATVTGLVIGTPWYMSPEQARGGQIDRRSDVWALGATLYDLLGGEPPFGRESNVISVFKLLSEDPPPLRNRKQDVPRDVETIVMKCLEKEPARRYDSARALADDLSHFLDGEPISARAPSLSYRLYTRARKNRATVAVGAVALVVIAAFAIAGFRARAAARRQVELASEFSGIVKDVEWRMRVAHLAPLHNTLPEKKRVREDLAKIEGRMRAVGGLAQGPGEYAMGRGQLLLGDFEGARKRLERAWASGFRGGEVAYALGLALGEIYKRERTLADGIGNRTLREAKQRENEKALRDPAISYLRQAAGLDEGSSAYVQALLAFYEKRYDDAFSRVSEVQKQTPWLYETRLLEGDIRAVQSQQRHETGDEAGSQQAVVDAEAAYRGAADYARSDPAAYEGLCQMDIQRMEALVYTRGDLLPLYTSAQEACGTALRADPERAEAYAKLSNIHRFWADNLSRSGKDPAAALKLAAETGQRALALDPGSRRANGNLGIVYRMQAEYAQNHGQDGSHYLEAAFQALQKAVELSGGDAPSVNDLGNAYSTRATAVRAKGGDPRPDLARAVEEYDKALTRVPDFGYAHANRGVILSDRAHYEMDHGVDPTRDFAESLRSLQRSAELLPKIASIHNLLADIHCLRAEFDRQQDRDPLPAIGAARKELELAKAILSQPDPDAQVIAGRTSLVEAERLLDTGASPLGPLAEARARFRDAQTRDTNLSDAPVGLGRVELLLARAAKGDPTEVLKRAAIEFQEASRRNPNDAEASLGQAETSLARARWKLTQGRPVGDDIAAGLSSIDRVLGLRPSLASAFLVRGSLLACAAASARDPGARGDDAARAEEAFSRAASINPFLSRRCDSERRALRGLEGAARATGTPRG